MPPVTNSDQVFTLEDPETATFKTESLNDSGHYAVNVVELLNLANSITQFQFDNGPVRSLAPYERYVTQRNVGSVTCVNGEMEVIFSI